MTVTQTHGQRNRHMDRETDSQPNPSRCIPGAAGFYRGRIAEAIVSAIQERGGVMSLDDLSCHKCEHREPIQTTYRGYHIYEVAPPTAVRTPLFISLRCSHELQLLFPLYSWMHHIRFEVAVNAVCSKLSCMSGAPLHVATCCGVQHMHTIRI